MILSGNRAADVIRELYEDPAHLIDDKILFRGTATKDGRRRKVYLITVSETDFDEIPEGAEPILL